MDLFRRNIVFISIFSQEYKRFILWVALEAMIVASALASNAMFLIIRFKFEQRITATLNCALTNIESDFLEAKQIEVGLITSWVTPFLTSLAILLSKNTVWGLQLFDQSLNEFETLEFL